MRCSIGHKEIAVFLLRTDLISFELLFIFYLAVFMGVFALGKEFVLWDFPFERLCSFWYELPAVLDSKVNRRLIIET